MIKVSLGIPVYGLQSKEWWGPLARQTAELYKQDIELVNLHVVSSMMTDVNRNKIVDAFLKEDAEWLRWIDADNIDKIGSLRLLLDNHKTLVTGLYTKRSEEGGNIAYFQTQDGSYETVNGFTPGEIFPIDAAGLGGCLVHRSVFEDIQSNFAAFDLAGGGVVTVHYDDITGDVFDDTLSEQDGRVIDGVLHQRLRKPKVKKAFPFFMLNHGRTEDYGFFEMARRSGHQLWLDTGVEIGHLGEKTYEPADVRENDLQRMLTQ